MTFNMKKDPTQLSFLFKIRVFKVYFLIKILDVMYCFYLFTIICMKMYRDEKKTRSLEDNFIC